MFKTVKVLFISAVICIFPAISVIAQDGSAAGGNLGTSKITSPPLKISDIYMPIRW